MCGRQSLPFSGERRLGHDWIGESEGGQIEWVKDFFSLVTRAS